MKRRLTQIFASALLLMFVNFMFSNTIFMHVHKDVDGQPVTHSHPYIPNAGHTHTGSSLNLLSGFNLSASTAIYSVATQITAPAETFVRLIGRHFTENKYAAVATSCLRGPPYKK